MVNERCGEIVEIPMEDNGDAIEIIMWLSALSRSCPEIHYRMVRQKMDSLKYTDGTTTSMHQFPLKLTYGVIAH
jgi:hypothetical protein